MKTTLIIAAVLALGIVNGCERRDDRGSQTGTVEPGTPQQGQTGRQYGDAPAGGANTGSPTGGEAR